MIPSEFQYLTEPASSLQVELPKVQLCRLFRIGFPELPWLLVGVLGCALTGSAMPVFAFFYGEVFRVSRWGL